MSYLSLPYSPMYVLYNDVMWFIDRQFLPEKYVSTNDEIEYISTSLLFPYCFNVLRHEVLAVYKLSLFSLIFCL